LSFFVSFVYEMFADCRAWSAATADLERVVRGLSDFALCAGVPLVEYCFVGCKVTSPLLVNAACALVLMVDALVVSFEKACLIAVRICARLACKLCHS
jgi:hypothetical protein